MEDGETEVAEGEVAEVLGGVEDGAHEGRVLV
jgi:hypothetical protein